MLREVPGRWFSYDFTIFDRGGTIVARADLSNWREIAKIIKEHASAESLKFASGGSRADGLQPFR